MDSSTDLASRAVAAISKSLACGICQKRQKDPMALACQHSFCSTCLEELEPDEPKQHEKAEGPQYEEVNPYDKLNQHGQPDSMEDPSQPNVPKQQEVWERHKELKENSAPRRIACPSCRHVTCCNGQLGLPSAVNIKDVLEEVERQELKLGEVGESSWEGCDKEASRCTKDSSRYPSVFPAVDRKGEATPISNTRLQRSRTQLKQILSCVRNLFAIRPQTLCLVLTLCIAYIATHPGTVVPEDYRIQSDGGFTEEFTDDSRVVSEESILDDVELTDESIPNMTPEFFTDKITVTYALIRLAVMAKIAENDISQIALDIIESVNKEESTLQESLQKTVEDRKNKIESCGFYLDAYATMNEVEGLSEDFYKVREEAERQTLRLINSLSFIALKDMTVNVNKEKHIGELLLQEEWRVLKQFYVHGLYSIRGIESFPNGDIVLVSGNKVHVYSPVGQLKGTVSPQYLYQPFGVAVDGNSSLYVTDGKRVQVFGPNLEYRLGFTPAEGDEYSRSALTCVATTLKGHVVVCDKGRQLISLHDSDGALIKTIPAPLLDGYLGVGVDALSFVYTNANAKMLLSVDILGNEMFKVDTSTPGPPSSVVCDTLGDIYLAIGDTRYSKHRSQGFQQDYSVQQGIVDQEKRYLIQRYSVEGAWVGAVTGVHDTVRAISFGWDGDFLVAGDETVYIYTTGAKTKLKNRPWG